MSKAKILVCGGCGFIGSEFIRQGVRRGYTIVCLDKLTYAGDLRRIPQSAVKFYKGDIADFKLVGEVIRREKPDCIVNFAAETHVDRSILDANPFLETNVKGTYVLLTCAQAYGTKKFLQVSTDEVYGEIKRGRFTERSPLNPNSPYAASKAAADFLVKAFHRTHNLPVLIARPSNTYGPYQHPEKLIPLAIFRALEEKGVPVYGRGENVREWLYLSDCCDGIFKILEKGRIGEVYNIGSGEEKKNIDVVKSILSLMKRPLSLIEFVSDRPGHDFRYALSTQKIKKLGFRAKTRFETGLEMTVDWYLKNQDWLREKVKEQESYFQKVSNLYSF